MKWNIDQELAKYTKLLEGDGLGVSIKRVLLAHSLFPKFNLPIKDRSVTASFIWVLRIPHQATFVTVCGHSIRECFIVLKKKLRRDRILKTKPRIKFKKPQRRPQKDE